MKKHAFMVIPVVVVVLLVVAAGGMLVPPRAAAQPQPTMVISPASGPCDATVEVQGTGFEAGGQIPIDLGGPHSDISIARLAIAGAGPDGQFRVSIALGSLGCQAATIDAQLDRPGEPKDIVLFAGADPARMSVITRASYEYTTTTASVARVLPPAGDGTAALRGSGPTALIAVLAGVGALLLVAGLCARAAAGMRRRRRPTA